MTQCPAIERQYFDEAIASKLLSGDATMPRILILYGSVRERSYSRFAAEEAGRLLKEMGAEVKIFNPSGLPLPDDAPDTHPKVLEQSAFQWNAARLTRSRHRERARIQFRAA